MKRRGPLGNTYTVRRRWLPWRRKVDVSDAPVDLSGAGADDFGGLALIGLLIALPFIIIGLVALAELLLLLVLLPVWLLVRVLLGRPWTVDVRRDRALVHTEQVVGWRSSGLRMRELLDEATQARR